MKKSRLLSLSLILLCGLFMASSAQAAIEPQETVFIPKERTFSHNVIRIGSTIDISGTLEKDAYLLGENVTIDGTIKGDLVGASETLKVNGTVEGNVRFAAESIIINGTVGKNVTIAASSIVIGPDANVGWELLAAARSLEMNGNVFGNMNFMGQKLEVKGNVGGRLDLAVEEGDVTFTDTAVVNGDIEYSARHEAVIAEGAQLLGNLTKNDSAVGQRHQLMKKLFGWTLVISFFAYLLIILLLFWVAPKFMTMMQVQTKNENLLKNIGYGALVLLVVPIVSILLMVTIIGVPLALISLVMYIIMVYLARIIFAMVLGQWVMSLFKLKEKPKLLHVTMVGLLIFVVLKSIPYFGSVLDLFAVLIGLGALAMVKKDVITKHFR